MLLTAAIVLFFLVSGCASQQMKGERDAPDLAPMNPATDVRVEQNGDLMCVTEREDPRSRTCVPKVHEEED